MVGTTKNAAAPKRKLQRTRRSGGLLTEVMIVFIFLSQYIQKTNGWFWWFYKFSEKASLFNTQIHIHFDLRVSDFVLDLPEVGDFFEAIRLVLAPNACSKRWYRSFNGNLTIQYSLLAQS